MSLVMLGMESWSSIRQAASSGAGDGGCTEREADGVDGADGSSPAGFDDASGVGVEDGGPFAAEAVGDLAIHRAGAQGAFGAVVGGAERPVGDEDEQVAAHLGDDLDQRAAGVAVRGQV